MRIFSVFILAAFDLHSHTPLSDTVVASLGPIWTVRDRAIRR